jgi:hypothetical protein
MVGNKFEELIFACCRGAGTIKTKQNRDTQSNNTSNISQNEILLKQEKIKLKHSNW